MMLAAFAALALAYAALITFKPAMWVAFWAALLGH